MTTVFQEIGTFFENVAKDVEKDVSGSSSVTAAATAIKTAESAVEGAVPTLIEAGVNAVLALVPGGSNYVTVADAILNGIISSLKGKVSTPPAAS